MPNFSVIEGHFSEFDQNARHTNALRYHAAVAIPGHRKMSAKTAFGIAISAIRNVT